MLFTIIVSWLQVCWPLCGIRGSRYGENVLETLKNKKWVCPICRGICNCSLCRPKQGWAPTGSLYRKVWPLTSAISVQSKVQFVVALLVLCLPASWVVWISQDLWWIQAIALGYKSVAHYLILTRRAININWTIIRRRLNEFFNQSPEFRHRMWERRCNPVSVTSSLLCGSRYCRMRKGPDFVEGSFESNGHGQNGEIQQGRPKAAYQSPEHLGGGKMGHLVHNHCNCCISWLGQLSSRCWHCILEQQSYEANIRETGSRVFYSWAGTLGLSSQQFSMMGYVSLPRHGLAHYMQFSKSWAGNGVMWITISIFSRKVITLPFSWPMLMNLTLLAAAMIRFIVINQIVVNILAQRIWDRQKCI